MELDEIINLAPWIFISGIAGLVIIKSKFFETVNCSTCSGIGVTTNRVRNAVDCTDCNGSGRKRVRKE